jgi:FlaA1/EpsC-like NDP-sugar epimerase
MKVVGFVDDNLLMRGMEIQHAPVLGKFEDIPDIIKKHAIDEIIIANPSTSYKDITKVIDLAEQNGVRAKILPDLGRIIQEGAYRGVLKEVSYDELLGRKAIIFRRENDIKILDEEIKGKRILITGAGGSIGSELCMHVARFKPALLLMYDRYENTSYGCEMKLKKEFPDVNILPIIGDILDRKKFGTVLKQNGIELIYHAAAYKHVPLMERQPLEAIRNNIWGTYCVASEAVAKKVNKFIMVSTDKAVNPTSIMGASKRVAELIVQALACNETKFISVRFGNVVGSDGSVIPLFKKQIMEGGPITITHPEVSRYFMSISEAVQLVMTAGALGKGGEIFLLDMGEPVKIVDVAKRMIEYMGLNPEKDIDIQFVGLRPGERLHEELFWKGEGIVPTENKKITQLKPREIRSEELLDRVKALREFELAGNLLEALRLLKGIVPEAKIQGSRI